MAKSGAVFIRYTDHWQPASTLHTRQKTPKFAPLQIPGLGSVLPHGLARGTIAEVRGRRSSGRTAACLHILAQATQRGEVCAVVDLYNGFHPASAAASGVRLDRLIWVRCCGNAEHAMRAADLLLHAGGFGIVLLDFCEANATILNRIPLSYWHRFRRAIEQTLTILLLCGAASQAKSTASVSLELRSKTSQWTGKSPFLLLRGLEASALLSRASGPVTDTQPSSSLVRSTALLSPKPLYIGTVA